MRFRVVIKLAIFILIAVGFAGLLIFNRKGFLTYKETILSQPQNLLANIAKLPVERMAPTLIGILGWINSTPLSEVDLRGKVVLIDFWTYSCINCIRTLPHLNEWYKKYKDNGLVILGMHSPEFDFEKDKENVQAAVKKYNIEYPVALDSNHETWKAFGNQYWPAHYLIDVNGNIRYHSFGEGHYAETESAIQNLLSEASLLTLDKIAEVKEPPADTIFQNIGTPEIYLGYLRINNAGNIDSKTKPDLPHTFIEPETIQENKFYFTGTWIIGPEAAELIKGGGKLTLRYKASRVNIVAESKDGKAISLGLFLDEKPKGTTSISSPQLYNLIDATGDGNWHTLEIRIPTSGLRTFTFTFG